MTSIDGGRGGEGTCRAARRRTPTAPVPWDATLLYLWEARRDWRRRPWA